MDHMFATNSFFRKSTKRLHYLDFSAVKTASRRWKLHILRASRPFVNLEETSRRMPKIMQNYFHMYLKTPQNEQEKYGPRSHHCKKTPITFLRASFICFSRNPSNVGLSSTFSMSKTHEKAIKIVIFEPHFRQHTIIGYRNMLEFNFRAL